MSQKTQVQGGNNMSATVKVRTFEDKKVDFNKEVRVGSDGQEYTYLSTEKFSISLFNAKVADDPEKGSRILYNATLTFKTELGTIIHRTAVKQLTKGDNAGQLMIGQASRMNNMRSIVNEWDGKTKNSYERASIPSELYAELIGIIEAGIA